MRNTKSVIVPDKIEVADIYNLSTLLTKLSQLLEKVK